VNRITQLFNNKKSDILNVYFTAGYPELNNTGTIIHGLESAGVDLIELGMPYSDPMADGPTIQESGSLALKNGMTVDLLFNQVEEVRKTSQVPLILMGYFNQVMQYGDDKFFKRCAEVGVDGLILPDMPLHVYERDYKSLFESLGLTVSFLITPQTPDDRIRKIDELTNGFIYVVSSYAITGAKSGIQPYQIDYFKRINDMNLSNPRLIGFGISDNETFTIACEHAAGAIIGSAFIRALGADGDLEEKVRGFIGSIRNEAPAIQ